MRHPKPFVVFVVACGVHASSLSADKAKALKDSWKELQASVEASSLVSVPLRKTLGVYRTLLSALEQFEEGFADPRSTFRAPETTSDFTSSKSHGGQNSTIRIDPYELPSAGRWGHGGMFGVWPVEDLEAGRAKAMEAWEVAGDAASYARVSPFPNFELKGGGEEEEEEERGLLPSMKRDSAVASAARVPVRVDVVPVGLKGEGLHALDISDASLKAWFQTLASDLPLSSLHGPSSSSFSSSPAVVFSYEFRLVSVSPSVCVALERFLERHLIRPTTTAPPRSAPASPPPDPPYVPTWRMEAFLGDLATAVATAEADARREERRKRREKAQGQNDLLLHAHSLNDEGEEGLDAVGQPALTLFVLNPRRTFVSNYNHETYGYRSGLGFSELEDLLRVNRSGLLEEAVEAEQASVDSWRHQTPHTYTHLNRRDGTTSLGGGGGGGDDDDDEEKEEGRIGNTELANEEELVFTESTLERVRGGREAAEIEEVEEDQEAAITRIAPGGAVSLGRRVLRSLDATAHTGAWAEAFLEAVKVDDMAAAWEEEEAKEEEEEGGGGGGGASLRPTPNSFSAAPPSSRAARELSDLTSGRAVLWRSSVFAEEIPTKNKNPSSSSSSSSSSFPTMGEGLAPTRLGFRVPGGRRRRRAVLRDLLAHARADAQLMQGRTHHHHHPVAAAGSPGASGAAGSTISPAKSLSACLTDLWLSSPLPAASLSQAREAYPSVQQRLEGASSSSSSSTSPHPQRVAWLDLSAGPFHWGPTFGAGGGRGVRTAGTLPRAPPPRHHHKNTSPPSHHSSSNSASETAAGRGTAGASVATISTRAVAEAEAAAAAADEQAASAKAEATEARAHALDAQRKKKTSEQGGQRPTSGRRDTAAVAAALEAGAGGGGGGGEKRTEEEAQEWAKVLRLEREAKKLEAKAEALSVEADTLKLQRFVEKRVLRLNQVAEQLQCSWSPPPKPSNNNNSSSSSPSSSSDSSEVVREGGTAAAAKKQAVKAKTMTPTMARKLKVQAEKAKEEEAAARGALLCKALSAEVSLLETFANAHSKLNEHRQEFEKTAALLAQAAPQAKNRNQRGAAHRRHPSRRLDPAVLQQGGGGGIEAEEGEEGEAAAHATRLLGDLRQSYAELLQRVHARVAPLESLHPTRLKEWEREEGEFLSKLGAVVKALATQVLTPPLSVPTFFFADETNNNKHTGTPPPPGSSAGLLPYSDTRGATATAVVSPSSAEPASSSAAAAASVAVLEEALAHSYPEAFVVDLFVVRDHDHYDPLDVASGGVDVSAVKEALFSMVAPLDQALSFTVHSVRSHDDPALALALATSTSAAVVPRLDPASGEFVPTVTQCVDSASLRRSLKAIDRREEEEEEEVEALEEHKLGQGSGGGASGRMKSRGGGGGGVPHHHFGLSSHASVSSYLPTSVHVPVFLLSLAHGDALLDCDNPGGGVDRSTAGLGDAFSEAKAVGPPPPQPSSQPWRMNKKTGRRSKRRQQLKKRALDMVIAVQTPSTFEPLSGFSCGSSSQHQHQQHHQLPQQSVPRSPRNPARALVAAAASLMGLVPPDNALLPPHAAPPAMAASPQSLPVVLEQNWLFAAASELPSSALSRHPVVGALAGDTIARAHIAQALSASVTVDRATVALLRRIPTSSSSSSSSTSSSTLSSSSRSPLPALPLSFGVHQSLYEVRRLLSRAARRRAVLEGLAAQLDFKTAARHLNALLGDSRAAYKSAVAVSRAHLKHTCALASSAASSPSSTPRRAARFTSLPGRSGRNDDDDGDGSTLPLFHFHNSKASSSSSSPSFAKLVVRALKLLAFLAAALAFAAVAVVAWVHHAGTTSPEGRERATAVSSPVMSAVTKRAKELERAFLRSFVGGVTKRKPKIN